MKLEQVILRDTRAAQPGASAVPVGTIYYVTDEGRTERSNGTTWEGYSDVPGGVGGFGDVIGPASAVDDRIATFDGATGKLIQDGGQTIAQVIAAASGGGVSYQTTSLTGTQHNLVLTPARDVLLDCQNASDLTITGIDATGWSVGDQIRVITTAAGKVSCAHADTGSLAANRITARITSGTLHLAAYQGNLTLIRSVMSGTSWWVVHNHDQGAYLQEPYEASDFAPASGTWTVEAADYSMQYYVCNHQIVIAVYIVNSSITGTPAFLTVKVPNNYRIFGPGATYGLHVCDNGTWKSGAYNWSADTFYFGPGLPPPGSGAWANSTHNTGFAFFGTFFLM